MHLHWQCNIHIFTKYMLNYSQFHNVFNFESQKTLLVMEAGSDSIIRAGATSHSSALRGMSVCSFSGRDDIPVFSEISCQHCDTASGAATLVMSPSEETLPHKSEEIIHVSVSIRGSSTPLRSSDGRMYSRKSPASLWSAQITHTFNTVWDCRGPRPPL